MNFKLLKSAFIHHGRIIDLKCDEIQYNNSGNIDHREVVIHPGGAVVVPVTDNNRIIMVTQYRYPIDKIILELPAGKLNKGEDPLLCAERELEEETGYKSSDIIKLGAICTTPGFCNEILHIYLAKNLMHGQHNREEGEQGMEIFEYSFAEAEEKIAAGEIIDAKTICGIFMAKKFLKMG